MPVYSHPSHFPPSPPIPHYPPHFNPMPKLEFSKFDGTDPKSWLMRAEQYFDFIPMDDVRKVKLSGLHFEGRANA